MIQKILIYSSELIMTTLVKIFLKLTGRLQISRSIVHPFHIRKRYIYVSNHASYLDPLVLWAVLSFTQRVNGAPTKVMTTPSIYYGPLRPLIWLLGAFPARKSSSSSRAHAGIDGALYYMNQGYNIAIFPEGKRSLPSENRAFRGVSEILAASDASDMVLIRIIWGEGPWWRRSLELRASLAPLDLNHHDPSAIMRAVYKL